MMEDDRLDVLAALAAEIASRKSAPPEQSYTALLLSQGIAKCAKKLGEEAVETAIAAVAGDKREVASESADLLYHLLVVMEATGVSLLDVMTELERRRGTGGLAEKAARPKD
jgi:phosphoribosyl-ATP pyrophosphohydrolase